MASSSFGQLESEWTAWQSKQDEKRKTAYNVSSEDSAEAASCGAASRGPYWTSQTGDAMV